MSQDARGRTEVAALVARALAARVRRALRAVHVRVVLIPHVAEEVDLALVKEERGRDAVDRRVAPALWRTRGQS